MFAQQQSNRRRFLGLAALSLAGAWIGTRDSVQLITMKPFRPSGTVTEQRLYQLIRQSGSIAERQFEIEFLDAGVEAFAFAFG